MSQAPGLSLCRWEFPGIKKEGLWETQGRDRNRERYREMRGEVPTSPRVLMGMNRPTVWTERWWEREIQWHFAETSGKEEMAGEMETRNKVTKGLK